MAEPQITRVPIELVTPIPYVGSPSVKHYDGILPAGEKVITTPAPIPEGAGILLFISGIQQSNFTYNDTKITISEPVVESVPYAVIVGDIMLNTNPPLGTMSQADSFKGIGAPSESLGKPGDFYIQED